LNPKFTYTFSIQKDPNNYIDLSFLMYKESKDAVYFSLSNFMTCSSPRVSQEMNSITSAKIFVEKLTPIADYFMTIQGEATDVKEKKLTIGQNVAIGLCIISVTLGVILMIYITDCSMKKKMRSKKTPVKPEILHDRINKNQNKKRNKNKSKDSDKKSDLSEDSPDSKSKAETRENFFKKSSTSREKRNSDFDKIQGIFNSETNKIKEHKPTTERFKGL
jgi:hypothetical protein